MDTASALTKAYNLLSRQTINMQTNKYVIGNYDQDSLKVVMVMAGRNQTLGRENNKMSLPLLAWSEGLSELRTEDEKEPAT